MFLDFAIISVLLVIAHLMRSRIKLLQDLFLPTAIIAGLLGLIGGQQVADILPFARDASGQTRIGSYPGFLVAVLFATLFLGARPKGASVATVVRKAGDTFFYNLASFVGQYGFALLFGLLVLVPLFPGLNSGFALLLPAGFVGGHGTAQVVGGVLQSNGWDEALTIGYTFATVGVLAGIAGGMLLVNVGTRRGWTRIVRSPQQLPEGLKRGFLAEGEQPWMGRETVSPIALDPLAWHFALVLAACAAAYGVSWAAKPILPQGSSLPVFAVAMLLGACLQKALDAVGVGRYVDRHVMERIGSAVSDYLIAFAVASIKLTVVVKYAVPLSITSLFGILYAVGLFWFVGRRLYHNFWFSRSIFVYGWNTGVVGIGVTLLRVVDPRLETKTLEDFGLAYVLISFVEITVLVVLPPLVAAGVIAGPAVVLIAAFLVCILLSRWLVGWFAQPPDS